MGAIVNDLFKKRSQLAQKLASMTPDDVLKMRTGYAGKSQQWQYGFDLACREKQTEIDALKAQNADLLAAQEGTPCKHEFNAVLGGVLSCIHCYASFSEQKEASAWGRGESV